MQYEYQYDLVDGHLVLKANSNSLLVDTGAPVSVGDSDRLDFAGNAYEVSQNYLGITPDYLSQSVGTNINGLLGMDILKNYEILFDPNLCKLILSDEELTILGDDLEIEYCMGIPVIETTISGQSVRMFFDTGAKLSYLNYDLCENFPVSGKQSDFYPGVGIFTTQTHSVPIEIGGREITLQVGILPEALQQTLMIAKMGGILGTAILKTNQVLFAARRSIISLQKRNT